MMFSTEKDANTLRKAAGAGPVYVPSGVTGEIGIVPSIQYIELVVGHEIVNIGIQLVRRVPKPGGIRIRLPAKSEECA